MNVCGYINIVDTINKNHEFSAAFVGRVKHLQIEAVSAMSCSHMHVTHYIISLQKTLRVNLIKATSTT